MLQYNDFYKMSIYANENWKANMSNEEMAYNAHKLFLDYRYGKKKNQISSSIQTLIRNFTEDIENDFSDENVRFWLEMLETQNTLQSV